MKLRKLVAGLMVMGSLAMVGCDDVKDTGAAMEESNKPKVEKKVEKKETEKTEDKKDVKEEKKAEPKKEAKGQCYDCGEYFPIKDMTYNGRSYHCGCIACEACGTRMHSKKEMNVSPYTSATLCGPCYKMEQEEMEQWEKDGEAMENRNLPETSAPMCSNCGKRPAVYVESELCEECVQSTGYQYGDELE